MLINNVSLLDLGGTLGDIQIDLLKVYPLIAMLIFYASIQLYQRCQLNPIQNEQNGLGVTWKSQLCFSEFHVVFYFCVCYIRLALLTECQIKVLHM